MSGQTGQGGAGGPGGAGGGRVPQQRLNQIAQRKLQALGVAAELREEGEVLEGVLQFSPGRLLRPGTREPLPRAAFRAVGHDTLRFTEPPLAGLPPIPFYDAPSLAALETRVAAALEGHLHALRQLAPRFQQLKLQTRFEPDRLQLRAALTTGTHVFELVADPGGVWVARVLTERGGLLLEAPREALPLRLEEFDAAVDLELHLSSALPRLEEAARGAAAAAAPSAGRRQGPDFVVEPPGPGALVLGLLARHFGPEAQLVMGPRVEVVQEFTVGGARYRFSAVHESGTTFRGRLLGPTGEKYGERFDLLRFPGVAHLVRAVLGVSATPPPPPSAVRGAGGAPRPNLPEHLLPKPGEVWAMSVLVEADDGKEVRYVCTDIDGRPYGATRLLPREDFHRLFVQQSGGWRLLVRVDQVTDTHATYRQLDARRQPLSTPKQLALAVLASTFVPEGA
jgi:hypothetical protein